VHVYAKVSKKVQGIEGQKIMQVQHEERGTGAREGRSRCTALNEK
jgi:hypothetical protein